MASLPDVNYVQWWQIDLPQVLAQGRWIADEEILPHYIFGILNILDILGHHRIS